MSDIKKTKSAMYTTKEIKCDTSTIIRNSQENPEDLIDSDLKDIENDERSEYHEVNIFGAEDDIKSILHEGYSYEDAVTGTPNYDESKLQRLYVGKAGVDDIDQAIQKYLSGSSEQHPLVGDVDDQSEILIEDAINTNKRKTLSDDSFGLPHLRMFPIHERKRVNQAIRFFNIVNNENDRKTLASNIVNAYEKLNMKTKVTKANKLYDYIPDSMKLKPLSESSTVLANKLKSESNEHNSQVLTIRDKEFVPVFVLLTSNKTLMGSAIRKFTSELYNHASMSFDYTLNKIYSFNVSGFVEESIYSGPLSDLIETGSKYTLYVTFVTKDKAKKMEESIVNFKEHMKDTTYNGLGLVKYALSIPQKKYDEYHQFCSEFVTNMLKMADENIVKTQAALTSPTKIISESDKFIHVSKGLLKSYNPNKTIDKLKKIIVSNRITKYLVENSIFYNNLFYNPDFAKYILTIQEFDFFNYFCPSVKFGLTNQMQSSIGGLYHYREDLRDSVDNDKMLIATISSMYHKDANRYKVETLTDGATTELDYTHIMICVKLYDIVDKILNREYTSIKDLDPDSLNALLSWRQMVAYHLSVYGDETDESKKSIQRQYLYDLLWDFRDSIYDPMIISANIVGFCRELDLIQPLLECHDLIDPQETYAYLKNNVLTDDMYFLIPSEMMYPIFDKQSVNMAMSIVDTIEELHRSEYIDRLNNFYRSMHCNFKLLADHPFAKYDTNGIVLPLHTINEFSSTYNSFNGVNTTIRGTDILYSDQYGGDVIDLSENIDKLERRAVDVFAKLVKPGEKL